MKEVLLPLLAVCGAFFLWFAINWVIVKLIIWFIFKIFGYDLASKFWYMFWFIFVLCIVFKRGT